MREEATVLCTLFKSHVSNWFVIGSTAILGCNNLDSVELISEFHIKSNGWIPTINRERIKLFHSFKP